MDQLLAQSEVLVHATNTQFKRFLYYEINWTDRLIGIKGARGTGKTTMLLQKLKELSLPPHKAAYFSLDDMYFTTNTLVDTVRNFHKNGGEYLFIDEVHKYPNWSREIKNVYDQLKDLNIVFTGSSIIDISRQEVDLSRRVLMWELPGLSFREYLKMNKIADVEQLTLIELLDPQVNKRALFPNTFKPYEYFSDYLKYGYYPFSIEDTLGFYRRLKQVVRLIVEFDMAELKEFDIRNAKKMLQLLQIISDQVPFKPNLVKLAERSSIHRNTVLNYLFFLDQAKLIHLLYPYGNSIALLQKPEKIYLENPNLLYALSTTQINIGTVRETFFLNQLKVRHNIFDGKAVDFIVDGDYYFEVGGSNKGSYQIKNLKNAYLVKDDLEYPIGNSIPLWIFGFLY